MNVFTVITVVAGMIVIPYNVWLVLQIFDLRSRLSKVEGNCSERLTWLRNMDAKVDDLIALTNQILGKLEK